MSFVLQILIGVAIAAIGTFFVIKTPIILDFFGGVEWAERHLGGSRLFYKLLGIVFILLGLIVATDMWNSLLNSTLGSIFPSGKK
jgi:hypothetical protein